MFLPALRRKISYVFIITPEQRSALAVPPCPAAGVTSGTSDFVMTIDSVSTLIDTLRYERLLDAEQLGQLSEDVLISFDTPQDLARHLVQAGWLTAYQIRHLFEDHSTRLVI